MHDDDSRSFQPLLANTIPPVYVHPLTSLWYSAVMASTMMGSFESVHRIYLDEGFHGCCPTFMSSLVVVTVNLAICSGHQEVICHG